MQLLLHWEVFLSKQWRETATITFPRLNSGFFLPALRIVAKSFTFNHPVAHGTSLKSWHLDGVCKAVEPSNTCSSCLLKGMPVLLSYRLLSLRSVAAGQTPHAPTSWWDMSQSYPHRYFPHDSCQEAKRLENAVMCKCELAMTDRFSDLTENLVHSLL